MKITLVLVVELCAAPVRSHCTLTFLLLNKRARKKKEKIPEERCPRKSEILHEMLTPRASVK